MIWEKSTHHRWVYTPNNLVAPGSMIVAVQETSGNRRPEDLGFKSLFCHLLVRQSWESHFISLSSYWTQVQLIITQKPIIERQVSVESKDALVIRAGNLRRRWTHAPWSTPKILLSWQVLEEKEERISVNYQGRWLDSAPFSIECWQVDSF